MIKQPTLLFVSSSIGYHLKIKYFHQERMDTEITLGYWNARGLAQVPRLLLTYTQAKWRDKIYTDRESWFNRDKKNLGLAFPNLPYLLDGSLKLTESAAIQRYIVARSGRKELLGKDLKDSAMVDGLLGECANIAVVYTPLFFSERYEDERKVAVPKLEKPLQRCQGFYGDKNLALGYLTLPDFVLGETAYYIREISPELYNKFPFLERVRAAVEALSEVQAYYKREGAIREPFVLGASGLRPKLSS
jgi:glutathione S-transferase